MDGLICCKNMIRYVEDSSTLGHCEKLTDDESKKYLDEMSKKGFIPNYERDCFVLDGYGAYMGTTISKDLDSTFYWEYFMSLGYKLILGPSPYEETTNAYGVFCKNYEELFQKHADDLNKEKENKEVGIRLLKSFASLFKHK